jgi:REP-associated tyrosine transposase
VAKRSKRPVQLSLPRTAGWGGKRAGAGRKPAAGRRRVLHVTRPRLAGRHPVLVTVRGRPGSSFRVERVLQMFHGIAAEAKEGFAVRHFSVQRDHLHLVVEAADKACLRSGMASLLIRFALRLNKLLGVEKGKVWADRYHRRDLATPREVRNALAYVYANFKKHGYAARTASVVDPFASGASFDGWRAEPVRRMTSNLALAPPKTWLLRVGWRRCGLIDPREAPAAA